MSTNTKNLQSKITNVLSRSKTKQISKEIKQSIDNDYKLLQATFQRDLKQVGYIYGRKI